MMSDKEAERARVFHRPEISDILLKGTYAGKRQEQLLTRVQRIAVNAGNNTFHFPFFCSHLF